MIPNSKSIHLTKQTSTEAWTTHNMTKKNWLRSMNQSKNNHKRSRDQFAKPERKRTASTMNQIILLTTVANRTRWGRSAAMSSPSPANPQLASSCSTPSSNSSSRWILHLSTKRRARRDQRREWQRRMSQEKISNCKTNTSPMNSSAKWMKRMSRFEFNKLKLITGQWLSKPHLLWMPSVKTKQTHKR